jgi:hypothetical protein
MTATDIPISCDLTAIPAERRAAHEAAAPVLLRGALAFSELPGGYAFRFPAEQLLEVAEFVDCERRCCPFFTFQLDVPPGHTPLELRITGPEGVKEMFAAELWPAAPAAPVAEA